MKTIRDTPEHVAKLILKEADIAYVDTILEPSAGDGRILDILQARYDHKLNIDAVELNKEKCDKLVEKGYNAFNMDFLNFNTKDFVHQKYTKIIAAPPFKDNIDLKHIMHMYEMLKYPGTLVSLTTPYWLTNNESHQVEFRKWLKGKSYTLTMLLDNSFMEKGKTVPTAIIKIYR